MNIHTHRQLIQGPVGKIEVAIDAPEKAWRGLALIAHPHPLFGGTFDNKVVHTLARACAQLGYACVRPNFRGVGASEGEHMNGLDEQNDMLAVLDWMQQPQTWQEITDLVVPEQLKDSPLVLAGFSFGSYVLSHVAARLAQQNRVVQRLILVGTPVSRWEVAHAPANTIVIHGEQDDTIPLDKVFEWARPQDLAVTVIPGADHFFHRKLHILKRLVMQTWPALTTE